MGNMAPPANPRPNPSLLKRLGQSIPLIRHLFTGPPDINVGLDGRVGVLERGPEYSQWLSEQLSGQQKATIPAVQRALDVQLGALLSLDLQVGQVRDDACGYQSFDPLPDHPLNSLFAAPSRVCSAADLWSGFYKSYLADGNSYLLVRRTSPQNGSLPIELVPVACSKTVALGNPLSRAGVRVRHALTPWYGDAFPDRDFWDDAHVVRCHRPSTWQPRSFKSLPPISGYALSVIRNNELLQSHYRRRLSRPMASSSLITVDSSVMDSQPDMSLEQYQEFCNQFGDELAEWLHRDKVIVLPPGFGVSSGINELDLKAMDLLGLTVDEVARIFGTPPAFLFKYEVQSFRAFEQEATAFARRSVFLHTQIVADALTKKLLLPEERIMGQRVFMPIDPIELGTMTERIAAATMAYADGAIWDRNEARGATNRPHAREDQEFCEPRGGPSTRTPQQGPMPQQQAPPLETERNGHHAHVLPTP